VFGDIPEYASSRERAPSPGGYSGEGIFPMGLAGPPWGRERGLPGEGRSGIVSPSCEGKVIGEGEDKGEIVDEAVVAGAEDLVGAGNRLSVPGYSGRSAGVQRY